MSRFKAELKGIVALIFLAGVIAFFFAALTGKIDLGVYWLGGSKPVIDKIAFVSSNGGQLDLYLMDASGGNLQRLTNDKHSESEVIWNHKATDLFFVSDKPGTPQIFEITADGRHSRQVTIVSGSKLSLSVNKKGLMVFVSQGKVYTFVNEKTEPLLPTSLQIEEQVKITKGDIIENPWPYKSAAVSSQSNEIAAVQEKSTFEYQEPQYLSSIGAEPQPILLDGEDILVGKEVEIAWQKLGPKLAIAVNGGPLSGLYVTEPSSASASAIFFAMEKKIWPSSPEWSPDGRKIAFVGKDKDGNTLGLYLASSDDGTGVNVSKLVEGEIRRPRWSPNGKRILFEMMSDNRTDLWTIEIINKRMVNLTKELKGSSYGGEWSPAVKKRN